MYFTKLSFAFIIYVSHPRLMMEFFFFFYNCLIHKFYILYLFMLKSIEILLYLHVKGYGCAFKFVRHLFLKSKHALH
jgi:hypothetical protein